MFDARNFAPLVALNALIQIEPKSILHVATRLIYRHWAITALEIITFDLLHVGRHLPAGVRLAQDPSSVVQEEEHSKGHGHNRCPQQHALSTTAHEEEDEAKHRSTNDYRISQGCNRGHGFGIENHMRNEQYRGRQQRSQ